MLRKLTVGAALCALLLIPTRIAAQDMIPVSQINFVGGPDISAWPATAALTRVVFTPAGTAVEFTKDGLPSTRGGNGWPDTCMPFESCKESGGAIDMGALQYSFGVVLKVNGQWVASAPIESWYQRLNPGGPINDQNVVCPSGSGQLHCNWFYDANRWPGLVNARPQPGEQIGVFVVAGDARNGFNPLHERSNIVVLNLPNTGAEVAFDFPAGPVPVPDPKPTPVPSDLKEVLAAIAALNQRVSADEQVANGAIANFEARITVLERRPTVSSCTASLFGFNVNCKVQ